MHWPLIYLPGERLDLAELSAARLDGDLVEVGDGYMPADAVESPAMRAASLRAICGTRLVACLWSAAWVYGALGDPPTRHAVMRGASHRVGNLIGRRAVLHDVGAPDADVVEIAGVLVTSPLRTLVDVARQIRLPEQSVRANAVVAALVEGRVARAEDALARIASTGRQPGSRDARRALQQHATTSVTAP